MLQPRNVVAAGGPADCVVGSNKAGGVQGFLFLQTVCMQKKGACTRILEAHDPCWWNCKGFIKGLALNCKGYYKGFSWYAGAVSNLI